MQENARGKGHVRGYLEVTGEESWFFIGFKRIHDGLACFPWILSAQLRLHRAYEDDLIANNYTCTGKTSTRSRLVHNVMLQF